MPFQFQCWEINRPSTQRGMFLAREMTSFNRYFVWKKNETRVTCAKNKTVAVIANFHSPFTIPHPQPTLPDLSFYSNLLPILRLEMYAVVAQNVLRAWCDWERVLSVYNETGWESSNNKWVRPPAKRTSGHIGHIGHIEDDPSRLGFRTRVGQTLRDQGETLTPRRPSDLGDRG
jgi:hypothetical protein